MVNGGTHEQIILSDYGNSNIRSKRLMGSKTLIRHFHHISCPADPRQSEGSTMVGGGKASGAPMLAKVTFLLIHGWWYFQRYGCRSRQGGLTLA